MIKTSFKNASVLFIFMLLSMLSSKSFANNPLIAELEVVAELENGENVVLEAIQLEQLPKDQQGFFKNRSHLKSQIKIAQNKLKRIYQEAQSLYGNEVKLRLRASLSVGSSKEEIFKINSLTPDHDGSEGPTNEAHHSQQNVENDSNGDLDERLYYIAKKVSKGFDQVQIQHDYKPVQKWYAYLAAKLGIPVHDVFYGFTAAATIGVAIYQVNQHNLDSLADSGFELSVSKEFAAGVLTAWSSLFEASTVLFTSFYIHWVNKGNLFLNRMKVSCVYLLFPIVFAFSVGLPMSDNANSLFEMIQNTFHTVGMDGFTSSFGEVSARFLDGLWRAFLYVVPTHLVFKSLDRVDHNFYRSAGNLFTVVAANLAAFLGAFGSQNGYSLKMLESWVNGKLSLQEFAISLSQYLPEWVAKAQVSANSLLVGVLGSAGLFAYSKILYKDWKTEQKEQNPDQKTTFMGWVKSLFTKSKKKTDCHSGFL